MASVLVSPEAQRQVDRLPKVIRARVWQLIHRLQQWPEISGAKPLRGKLAGKYRLRTGDYRLSSASKAGMWSSNKSATGPGFTTTSGDGR